MWIKIFKPIDASELLQLQLLEAERHRVEYLHAAEHAQGTADMLDKRIARIKAELETITNNQPKEKM